MVVAIILIVAAIAVANVTRVIRTARIRGAAVEYANLLQTTRTRAINDDRFYAVYVQPARGWESVDCLRGCLSVGFERQVGSGATAHRALQPRPCSRSDDHIVLGRFAAAGRFGSRCEQSECCVLRLVHAALILNNAPTWGPDGLPCKSNPSLDGTGTVCNSSGGPVAYVTYFQSTVSQQWSAVTVSPAGRVKAWHHEANGGGWSPQ
jgi:type II secretory pathway pseudopilin PulG